MKVTKDSKIYEVLEQDENTAPIFVRFGMHCLGCPAARGESIERATRAHGFECEPLLEALNEYFSKSAE